MINKKLTYILLLIFFSAVSSSLSWGQDSTVVDNIRLQENTIHQLYGETKVEDNIYSVSYVTAEDLAKTSSFSLFDALQGRLSGYRTYVRGLSSLNQGSVLILVDGFEQDEQFVQNMDIEEIQSVTIHKDAASTALFGQRSANGIMSIHTKRGYSGKPIIKANGTYGIINIKDVPEYYNSYDYTGFYNEARRNDGIAELYSDFERQSYKNGISENYPSTDWYKEALKDYGSLGKASLSIRGGDSKIKYFVFASYATKRGMFNNTDLHSDYSTQKKEDRVNIRSNFDIQVLENTSIKADIGGFINDVNSPSSSNYSIFNAIQETPPIIAGMYNDGTFGGSSTYTNNPLAQISETGYAKSHYRAIKGTFKLTQDFKDLIEGLKFNGQINFSNANLYSDYWSKDFATQYRQGGDTLKFGFDGTLDYNSNITQLRNSGTELYFDYNKTWNESNLTAMLGHRFSRRTEGGQNQTFSNMGFFSKTSYSNQDKYYADILLAYNGSQNFAPGNRYGFFPALALGWKASEEDFLKNNSLINFLKIRGSVGLTGSDHVTSYYRFMYFQQYNSYGGYHLSNDNSWKGGIVEGMPAYEDAKWENSLKVNLGLDLTLLENINLGIDVYTDHRTDILVWRGGRVPDLVGIDQPLDNLGEVRNSGIETTLDYTLKISDFMFKVNGYFNYNRSEVIDMNEIPRSEDYLQRTGKPLGQYFGLEAIGFFEDQADINQSPTQLFSDVKPGDIKYNDQNNDGIIDDFDEVAIGKSWTPEIIYAFSPSISYKGVTIEALFEGVARQSILLNTSQFWGFYQQRNIASNAVEGRWTEANKSGATVPRLTTMDNKNNYRDNDLWLTNGSFLKLRLLEIRYDLPKSLTNRVNIKGAQVYLRGQNLFSFDHLENADPENLGPEPSYSLKSIGLNLSF